MFAKQHLMNDELNGQCCIHTLLPRHHHLLLDDISAKHATKALAAAIHYQVCKCMCTHFTTSQNEIADLFQVERKKFFTSIMGQEYDARKKTPKIKAEPEDQQPPQPASE